MRNPGSDADIVLLPGDSIVIPEYNPVVTITGGVVSPTSVRYREGADLDYYVGAAGGFSSNADEDRVSVQFENGEIRTKETHLSGSIRSRTPWPEVVRVPSRIRTSGSTTPTDRQCGPGLGDARHADHGTDTPRGPRSPTPPRTRPLRQLAPAQSASAGIPRSRSDNSAGLADAAMLSSLIGIRRQFVQLPLPAGVHDVVCRSVPQQAPVECAVPEPLLGHDALPAHRRRAVEQSREGPFRRSDCASRQLEERHRQILIHDHLLTYGTGPNAGATNDQRNADVLLVAGALPRGSRCGRDGSRDRM